MVFICFFLFLKVCVLLCGRDDTSTFLSTDNTYPVTFVFVYRVRLPCGWMDNVRVFFSPGVRSRDTRRQGTPYNITPY